MPADRRALRQVLRHRRRQQGLAQDRSEPLRVQLVSCSGGLLAEARLRPSSRVAELHDALLASIPGRRFQLCLSEPLRPDTTLAAAGLCNGAVVTAVVSRPPRERQLCAQTDEEEFRVGDDGSLQVKGIVEGRWPCWWPSRICAGPPPDHARDRVREGIVEVACTWGGVAALREDGSVVAWGGTQRPTRDFSARELASGVVQVVATEGIFLALKEDGSLVSWGSLHSLATTGEMGPWIALSEANPQRVAERLASGVVRLAATDSVFAALKDDGSVVTWGTASLCDRPGLAERLEAGVCDVVAAGNALFALKADGSVVWWGRIAGGGKAGPNGVGFAQVAERLASDVTRLQSVNSRLVATKLDGLCVEWNNAKRDMND